MKKKRYIIGISAFILCIIGFVAVYMIFSPKPSPKGQKAYILEVSDGNKNIRYSGKTDSQYLSGLLDELKKEEGFDYESDPGDYGTYITSVNGIRSDAAKNKYWTIYVNGEYGKYGADLQPVNDGDRFTLRLESYE